MKCLMITLYYLLLLLVIIIIINEKEEKGKKKWKHGRKGERRGRECGSGGKKR